MPLAVQVACIQTKHIAYIPVFQIFNYIFAVLPQFSYERNCRVFKKALRGITYFIYYPKRRCEVYILKKSGE